MNMNFSRLVLVLVSSLAALRLASLLVPFSLVIQLYLLLLIALLFRGWPPVAEFLRGMPPPHAIFFGALLGAVLGGHFTLSTVQAYPFISWAIFPQVDERDPVVCRELIGTTRSGKKVRLLVEQLFPSIIQYNLPPAPTRQRDDLAPTVAAAARVYTRLHAEDPVEKIDLIRVAVPLHPEPGQPFPLCQTLQTFSAAPFRSN